jgi:hypothetical protein
MGTITRSFANNITTSGVLLPASLNNNSIANVTAYNGAISTGGMILLSTQTASGASSINFTSSINSTYKEYQFWFIDIDTTVDSDTFHFQTSTDGGSSYGVTATSAFFKTSNDEGGNYPSLDYSPNSDLAQSTSFQPLHQISDLGYDSDQSCSGYMSLFNPSSTTYVKHFISVSNSSHPADYSLQNFGAGYFNTTSAINAVRFKMNSGTITGTILMYGIV